MPLENENRSSALQPETLALINTSVSNAVQEAIKSMFSGLAPVLRDMALTPEKLEALKAPYVDPKKLARELRESAQSKEQEAETLKQLEWRRAHCPHLDQNQKVALCLVHNYPDRQPRGICPLCQDLIHPKEWVIGPPDPKTGKSVAFIRPAHKDYAKVIQLETMSS